DMVSMVVIALHTLYLGMYLTGWGGTDPLIAVAIAAYVTYVINATQFLLKLRQARLTEAN
ncbi:MAG: 2-vinyl bacteriochlorophyllide hydratase, partial [Granulosicoccus sp.]